MCVDMTYCSQSINLLLDIQNRKRKCQIIIDIKFMLVVLAANEIIASEIWIYSEEKRQYFYTSTYKSRKVPHFVELWSHAIFRR